MNTAAMDVAHTSCKYRISLLNWFHPAQGGLAQMKQKITVADYAQRITEALPQGVLLITPAIKHCHRGHWNHQVLDRVRESGDQSMTGRASGFVTEMS